MSDVELVEFPTVESVLMSFQHFGRANGLSHDQLNEILAVGQFAAMTHVPELVARFASVPDQVAGSDWQERLRNWMAAAALTPAEARHIVGVGVFAALRMWPEKVVHGMCLVRLPATESIAEKGAHACR